MLAASGGSITLLIVASRIIPKMMRGMMRSMMKERMCRAGDLPEM